MKSKGIFAGSIVFGLLMILCAIRLFQTENLEIFIPMIISTLIFGLFTWSRTGEIQNYTGVKQ